MSYPGQGADEIVLASRLDALGRAERAYDRSPGDGTREALRRAEAAADAQRAAMKRRRALHERETDYATVRGAGWL